MCPTPLQMMLAVTLPFSRHCQVGWPTTSHLKHLVSLSLTVPLRTFSSWMWACCCLWSALATSIMVDKEGVEEDWVTATLKYVCTKLIFANGNVLDEPCWHLRHRPSDSCASELGPLFFSAAPPQSRRWSRRWPWAGTGPRTRGACRTFLFISETLSHHCIASHWQRTRC